MINEAVEYILSNINNADNTRESLSDTVTRVSIDASELFEIPRISITEMIHWLAEEVEEKYPKYKVTSGIIEGSWHYIEAEERGS